LEAAVPNGRNGDCLADMDCLRSLAETICADGKKSFLEKAKIWSVVPGTPMTYGVVYDGQIEIENHMPMADLTTIDPSNNLPHDLTNVGCVVYKSGLADDTQLHQTPFLAKVKIRWAIPKPQVTVAKGILIIGSAN
jgi:hypothetical protein